MISHNMRGPEIHRCTKNNKNTEFEVEIVLRQAYFSMSHVYQKGRNDCPFCSETSAQRLIIHPLQQSYHKDKQIFVCKVDLSMKKKIFACVSP